MFNDSRGAAVYWTEDMFGMYNEKFIPTAAKAHPSLMGNPFRVGFPTAFDDMKPLFDFVFHDGECVEFERIELLLLRENDYLEEAYFVGQFIPIKGDGSKVEGTYNSGYECTAQVLYERRRIQVNKIAAISSLELPGFFGDVWKVLECNDRDVSMALICSADEETTSGKCSVRLQCSIGVPPAHPSAPEAGVIGQHRKGFLPIFEEVRESMKSLTLLEAVNDLQRRAGHLLDGIEWRGCGEPCRDLSIVPLQNASRLLGFMVLATNPRRAFDEISAQFVTDVSQQISLQWSSAITAENALKRERRLMSDLAEREKRIRHLAQYAPVGMVQLSLEGTVEWANDRWYRR